MTEKTLKPTKTVKSTKTTKTTKTPLVKRGPGNPTGKPKGTRNKVTSELILREIELQTGKPFARLLGEGYHAAILSMDFTARLAYEKLILSKVIADKHEMDLTSGGKSILNSFQFKKAELPDWSDKPILESTSEPSLKIVNAKSE